MAGALPAMHDSGEGAPLLLLHAFPLDASQWDHQVAALSGRYRCLRPDYWGCGTSPQPEGESSLDAYAAAVLRALDALDIDRFHVVGASMGGYVAFAILRAAPDRVLSLVLANTRATADTDTTRQSRLAVADGVLDDDSVESIVEPNIERLLGEHGRREVHVTDPVRGRIRRCTPAGVAHGARAMAARPDSTPMLATISMPTLVIAGAHDEVIPREDIEAMAAAIHGARLVTLPGGHLGNLEDPPAFTEELRRFLDAVPLVVA
jgi:pimeloyl-ACP methyl ester carboxylesterase